jgi:chromosome segregation ATPase
MRPIIPQTEVDYRHARAELQHALNRIKLYGDKPTPAEQAELLTHVLESLPDEYDLHDECPSNSDLDDAEKRVSDLEEELEQAEKRLEAVEADWDEAQDLARALDDKGDAIEKALRELSQDDEAAELAELIDRASALIKRFDARSGGA